MGDLATKPALFDQLDRVIEDYQRSPDALIQVLHQAQELFGYLRDDVLHHVARALHLPISKVYGVVTFYHFFTLVPRGKHRCLCCKGTACYVKGADRVIAEMENTLGVKMGETTKDNLFTLETARCLGSCGLAPAVMVDNDVHGQVSPARVRRMLVGYK
jgi:NADH:ubiquinone oxidoreductase subunit E